MVNRTLNSREEIASYMPHSGSMLLIDRVVEHGPGHIVVELDVGPRLPCYKDRSVPAYLGIEVMAQSIAAWSGIRRGDPSTRPPIGFLLGTRRFESVLPFFSKGSILKVRSQQVLENDGLGVFECEMDQTDADGVQVNVAMANISVYSMPENDA